MATNGRAAGARSAETPKLVPESPIFYTHEVIDKAIEMVVRQDATAPFPNTLKSVLAQGFRLLKPNLSKGALSGGRARMMRGVQSAYPNTTVNLLSSRPMIQLHAAVGDGIFLHLLLHTATLILLPNTCYLQITGPLMGNLLQPKVTPSNATSPHVRTPTKETLRTGVSQRETAVRDRHSGVGRPSSADEGEIGACSGAGAGGAGGRPAKRLGKVSLRRRALRVRSLGERKPGDGHGGGGGSDPGARGGGAGVQGPSKDGARHRTRKRKSVLGFVVPRWKVLYSATFPSRAGFPGGHFLNQLGTGQRCAAWLTREVLARRSTLGCPMAPSKDSRPFHTAPAKAKTKAKAPEAAGLPKARSFRLAKRDQALCSIMRRMLTRQKHIPYGLLLQRHCPPKVQENSPAFSCSDSSGGSWDTEASADADDASCGGARRAPPCNEKQLVGDRGPFVLAQPSMGKKRSRNDDARERGKEALEQVRQLPAPRPASNSRRGAFAGVSVPPIGKRFQICERARERAAMREKQRQKQRQYDTTKLPVSTRCVGNFVKAVVTRIVPFELWGSRTNLRAFVRSLRHFLGLRKYERFLIRHAMHGFKVSHCRWLTAHKIQRADVAAGEVSCGEEKTGHENDEDDELVNEEPPADITMNSQPEGTASTFHEVQATHGDAEEGVATDDARSPAAAAARRRRRQGRPNLSTSPKNVGAAAEKKKPVAGVDEDAVLAVNGCEKGGAAKRRKPGRREGSRVGSCRGVQEAHTHNPVLSKEVHNEGGERKAGRTRGARLQRQEAVAATQRVGRVVGFVWTGLVLPLIRTHFYVVSTLFLGARRPCLRLAVLIVEALMNGAGKYGRQRRKGRGTGWSSTASMTGIWSLRLSCPASCKRKAETASADPLQVCGKVPASRETLLWRQVGLRGDIHAILGAAGSCTGGYPRQKPAK